jgi:hypothetical protein
LAALLNHPEPNKVPELKKVTVDGKVFSINLSVSTKLFRDYISHGRMLLIEATDFAAFETISQTPYAPKVDSRVYNDRPLFLVRRNSLDVAREDRFLIICGQVLLLPDNAEAEICVPADRVAELASKWRATFIETKMTQLHQHFQKLILETNRTLEPFPLIHHCNAKPNLMLVCRSHVSICHAATQINDSEACHCCTDYLRGKRCLSRLILGN